MMLNNHIVQVIGMYDFAYTQCLCIIIAFLSF
jgi:hypothetical protein